MRAGIVVPVGAVMTDQQLAGWILGIALPLSNVLHELRAYQRDGRDVNNENSDWEEQIASLEDVGWQLCAMYWTLTWRALDDDLSVPQRFGS